MGKVLLLMNNNQQQQKEEGFSCDSALKKNYPDELTKLLAMSSNFWKVTWSIMLGVMSALYLVWFIYLGVYAYANPDKKAAFYIDGLDEVALTRDAILTKAGEADPEIPVRAGYPVNMGHLFNTWFMWGFWGTCFQVCMIIVYLPIVFTMPKHVPLLNLISGVLGGLNCCSNVAWFILGFFWRFSRAGRVASGEKLEREAGLTDAEWEANLDDTARSDGYQLKGGHFMAVYLWIILVLIMLSILSASVISIMNCVNKNDEE